MRIQTCQQINEIELIAAFTAARPIDNRNTRIYEALITPC
jgi:hypothetical protein